MQVHSIPGFHEPFSALSHLVGAGVFAILGTRLVRRGYGAGGPGRRARAAYLAVYVFCSVFLLAISGVFHLLRDGTTARAVLGRLDFAGIFMLIAGTQTPLQGLFFKGPARWIPLVLMWGVVAAGVVFFSIHYDDVPPALGTTVFIVLGWIAGASGLVIWRRIGTRHIGLLVAGGVTYSVGAVLMGVGWPTLIPGVLEPHDMWHVAVLAAMWMHLRFFHAFAEPGDEPVTPAVRARAPG